MSFSTIHSLSVATFCDIRVEGRLLVIRNRSRFEKTGEVVYGPIGGGVTVPGGVLQSVLNELHDFSPSPERPPSSTGLTDMRFELTLPAVGDDQALRLQNIAHKIIIGLPPENLSPKTELHEELVDEEKVLDNSDLEEAMLRREPAYLGQYVGDNRNNPGYGRLYCIVGARIELPYGTEEKLARHIATATSILRLVDVDAIPGLIASGEITPPTGILVGIQQSAYTNL